jgi:hypothetical protein
LAGTHVEPTGTVGFFAVDGAPAEGYCAPASCSRIGAGEGRPSVIVARSASSRGARRVLAPFVAASGRAGRGRLVPVANRSSGATSGHRPAAGADVASELVNPRAIGTCPTSCCPRKFLDGETVAFCCPVESSQLTEPRFVRGSRRVAS